MSFYKKCRTVKDDVYMMMHYQNELSIANNFNTWMLQCSTEEVVSDDNADGRLG